ncbi:hypothetical protein [Sphingorhabdus wooponensis]|jgi:hypothetical protein|nr:hypothetical protein [Sphingorhabdus wooponensis]
MPLSRLLIAICLLTEIATKAAGQAAINADQTAAAQIDDNGQ